MNAVSSGVLVIIQIPSAPEAVTMRPPSGEKLAQVMGPVCPSRPVTKRIAPSVSSYVETRPYPSADAVRIVPSSAN
jgi:hypothetical protein